VNPNLAVIFDEPQFPEAIHKKTHSGSRCANHLRQDFLTDLWNYLVGSRTGAVLVGSAYLLLPVSSGSASLAKP
jgi:hypothetical protein